MKSQSLWEAIIHGLLLKMFRGTSTEFVIAITFSKGGHMA